MTPPRSERPRQRREAIGGEAAEDSNHACPPPSRVSSETLIEESDDDDGARSTQKGPELTSKTTTPRHQPSLGARRRETNTLKDAYATARASRRACRWHDVSRYFEETWREHEPGHARPRAFTPSRGSRNFRAREDPPLPLGVAPGGDPDPLHVDARVPARRAASLTVADVLRPEGDALLGQQTGSALSAGHRENPCKRGIISACVRRRVRGVRCQCLVRQHDLRRVRGSTSS
jgi:hypothetical protein